MKPSTIFAIFVVIWVLILAIGISTRPMRKEINNTIDSLVAVKVDSIIRFRYGMFLKTKQDESVLLSELAYHRFLLWKDHPRNRNKLDEYNFYWEGIK